MSTNENSVVAVGSASAYLRKTLGNDALVHKKRIAQKDILQDVLSEINRTCNLIDNQVAGEDPQKLKIFFSDGRVINRFNENFIYVNPNVLKNEQGNIFPPSSDEFYSAVDALNGQALLCSFMKRHVTKTTARSFDTQDWSIKHIFVTNLHVLSLKEISDEWPGLQSYVDEAKKMFFRKSGEAIAAFYSSDRQLSKLIDLLCFNALSVDKINFADHFLSGDFVDRLNLAQEVLDKALNETIDDDTRLSKAQVTYETISRILGDSDVQMKSMKDRDGKSPNSDRDDQRKFAGDNSFNNFLKVDGDPEASVLLPEKQEGSQKNKKKGDVLRLLQSSILDGIPYFRIEPKSSPSARSCYNKVVAENTHLIRSVQHCFKFRNTEFSMESYGLPHGVLDDNSLYKIHLNDFDHLYSRREVKGQQKWLATLLLDQSASMVGKNRISHARKLSIIFSEAIKGVQGIDFSMYGFSGSECANAYCFKERNFDNLPALAEATTYSETPMGFSICHIADKMLYQYPDVNNKILFVITDGEPSGVQGRTETPVEHTRMCCELVRAKNIKVFGIGISNAFDETTGQDIFGANNFVVIDNVESCLNVLVSSLTKFVKRIQ